MSAEKHNHIDLIVKKHPSITLFIMKKGLTR